MRVSATSKFKWHTYGVFEAPHGWEPIVVTVDFAILHTLHGFGGVIFSILHTLHGFGEVKSVIFALGASGEPKLIWGGFGEPRWSNNGLRWSQDGP